MLASALCGMIFTFDFGLQTESLKNAVGNQAIPLKQNIEN